MNKKAKAFSEHEKDSLAYAIRDISVHDHLCLIYENKEEQFAAIVPFMRIGLERGEKCIYIADENTATEVLEAMRAGGIDVDAALKKGSLVVASKRESYLKKGYFDPDEMIKFLNDSADLAKKEGFKALRGTGEMTWMLGGEPGTERAMEYEAKLNLFLLKNNCSALCQYNKTRFSPDILMNVIRTHPLVVFNGVVCKNFYYVPVEEFLKVKKGSYEEVERLLRNLIDRSHAESLLVESEEKYRRLFEDSFDGAFVTSPQGKILDMNKNGVAIFGYGSKEEMMKLDLARDIYAKAEDRKRILDSVNLKGSAEYEIAVKKKNGEILDTICSLTVMKDSKGAAIVYHGIIRDVTEQKRSARLLQQNQLELARLNRMLMMLGGINQALVHITDEKTLLNETARIIGDIGGYSLMWIGFAEKDTAKTVRPVVWSGLSVDYVQTLHVTWADDEYGIGPTGMAIRTGKTQIIRDILADHELTPWREMAVKYNFRSSITLPLRNNGTVFGALNIYASEADAFLNQEVAILEELAGDLAFGITTLRLRAQTESRMRELDQLKNKFIQIVSHQLRTPLSAIRWNLELLLEQKRGELSLAQLEILRSAYSADIEIVSRIDDLMTALDIEESRLHLDVEKVDITEMIHSVCEERLQASALKRITYEIISPKEPLPILEVDTVKIGNVITRLIDNAIAYTQESGNIVIKYFSKEGRIRFEISDTGMGIPDIEKPHIFERFHRGWNAALMRPDASGLGLFISKSYIEAHNGAIGFTSVEKKGSTFWFELPITDHE